MRRLFLVLPAFLLWAFTAPPAVSANYQAGVNASLAGNYGAALAEWAPLAEQGDATPQFQLGWLYEKGLGVAKNAPAAVKWYRQAAEQGYAFAQSALGRMYEAGRGVARDPARAHMWFSLAAASWDQDAGQYRDRVAGGMTPAQLATAGKMAGACIAKRFTGC